jgi:hypothetical protein
LAHSPEAQQSIRRYVRNLALWLAAEAQGRALDEALSSPA